jgi:hypothetical protein
MGALDILEDQIEGRETLLAVNELPSPVRYPLDHHRLQLI